MNDTDKPELELSGSDGNSMMIIGKARGVARRAGWTKEKIEDFCNEAMSGDYDNVLQTCMKYFDVT